MALPKEAARFASLKASDTVCGRQKRWDRAFMSVSVWDILLRLCGFNKWEFVLYGDKSP